jgi:hypothetical protein
VTAVPDEIERLALLGWAVFPASQYSRASCFRGAHDAATSDLDTIARWCRDYPGCNWRVAFGLSGLWGLDIDAAGHDHAADGIGAMRGLTARYGALPPCPTTRSGGGGFACFFAWNGEPIIGRTGVPAPGIDPRRGRLSVTVPPSLHHRTGLPYRWIVPPWEVSPPSAPQWLLRLVRPLEPAPLAERNPLPQTGDDLRRYAIGALKSAAETVAAAPQGCRNHTLNAETWSVARFIGLGALTADEIAGALAQAAVGAGMNRREIARTLESALRARR